MVRSNCQILEQSQDPTFYCLIRKVQIKQYIKKLSELSEGGKIGRLKSQIFGLEIYLTPDQFYFTTIYKLISTSLIFLVSILNTKRCNLFLALMVLFLLQSTIVLFNY